MDGAHISSTTLLQAIYSLPSASSVEAVVENPPFLLLLLLPFYVFASRTTKTTHPALDVVSLSLSFLARLAVGLSATTTTTPAVTAATTSTAM